MKNQLDQLMQQKDVVALWVSGAAQHNPSMVYLTGGGHVTNADLFYLPGKTPYLCHGPMERDEAAKSGYQLISYADFDIRFLLKETGGDKLEAQARRYKQIFQKIGLTKGKVILYGHREYGPLFSVIKRLEQMLPDIAFEGDIDDAFLLEARSTKDELELERIRRMGHITVDVVQQTLDYLTHQKVKYDILMKPDNSPLTIGDVKRQINLWLAERDAENPEDTIFAIGRDSGVPHSSGTPTDLIRLGRTIVFDIFPCEKGGGYFYDFTRTWCLGYASDEIQSTYEQVLSVYNTLTSELRLEDNPHKYQLRTCELFEEQGHETINNNPHITQGYVHGVGHGVGLDVHEKPWFAYPDDHSNDLKPGSVFTIEPGLYYPEKGFGIRLEDTYFVNQKGTIARFVDYPLDLVIPMKGN